jgi:hypothetical protein
LNRPGRRFGRTEEPCAPRAVGWPEASASGPWAVPSAGVDRKC